MISVVAQALLVALSLLFVAGAVRAMFKAHRWRREHGAPEEPPLIDSELTRFGTPFSPIRESAARLVREGAAADNPATAFVTHRLAERTRTTLRENPWTAQGHIWLALAQVPIFTFQAWRSDISALALLGFFLLVAAVIVAAGMASSRHAFRRRENAERAMRLNQDLAASYRAERDRQEAAERTRSA